jgi:hypothetical protein
LPASNPSETHVVVLNGTETEGLAHRTSSNLQQSGYTLAAALSGHPSGSYPVTVVEYASGHHADASHVAQTLGVSQVRKLDPAVAAMANGATVVVIAGNDQAGAGSGTSGAGSSGTSGTSGGSSETSGSGASEAPVSPAGEASGGTGETPGGTG